MQDRALNAASGTPTAQAEKTGNANRRQDRGAGFAIRSFALFGKLAPQTASQLLQKWMFTPSRSKPRKDAAQPRPAAAEKHVFETETLMYYRWGSGPRRVLLVHGWSGEAASMTGFVLPLCQAGYEVVALDLPAHGRSTGKQSSVAHFEKAIAQAADLYGPFHAVIAHSLGAAAVTYGLSRGLHCQRLVYFGPVGEYEAMWSRLSDVSRLPRALVDMAVRHAERWLNVSFEAISPMRLASSMTTPLLVIQDAGDRECPAECAKALAASWPQASLLLTEDLGHSRILRDPAAIEKAVAFVAKT